MVLSRSPSLPSMHYAIMCLKFRTWAFLGRNLGAFRFSLVAYLGLGGEGVLPSAGVETRKNAHCKTIFSCAQEIYASVHMYMLKSAEKACIVHRVL